MRNAVRARRPATTLVATSLVGAMLLLASSARAHNDPAGCFETGVGIIVFTFRANGTTGVVGTISECETINYRVRLQKAQDVSNICAFSGGTLTLTTPDGVVHTISANVPCIGGDSGLEGCDPGTDFIESGLIPYTVSPADVTFGIVTATANYVGGVVHDNDPNTPGVQAATQRSHAVVFCDDANPCTTDTCDPGLAGTSACSNAPVICDDGDPCTTDSCDASKGCGHKKLKKCP